MVETKVVIIVIRVELLPTLLQRSLLKREYENLIRDKIRQDEFELNQIKPDMIDKEKK